MSASEKTGLVSAIGTSFEVIKTLVNGVKEIGGEEDDLRRILSDEYVREKIIKILCSETEILWTGHVIIDHNKTFKERVEPYRMVVSNLFREYTLETSNRKSLVELVLLRFNKKMSLEETICEVFKERNLQPASLEEIIALGIQCPHVVYKFGCHMEGSILAPGKSKKTQKGNYVEVPSLFWVNNISLSTHQCVQETSYYTPFLFIKSVESVSD